MTFSRAFLVCLLAGVATYPTSGQSQANPQTSSSSTDRSFLSSADTNPATLQSLTNPFVKPDATSGALRLRDPQLGVESRADADQNVCYTMRSYKVKRTERLADNQSGLRAYSTCEMASSYRLRSAEGNIQQPVRLK